MLEVLLDCLLIPFAAVKKFLSLRWTLFCSAVSFEDLLLYGAQHIHGYTWTWTAFSWSAGDMLCSLGLEVPLYFSKFWVITSFRASH